MKKVLPKIILGICLICIAVLAYFMTLPENKQDHTFLNYENLVSVASQAEKLPAIRSNVSSSCIIEGSKLAQFLDTADWEEQTGFSRDVQKDTEQNSRSSVQINLGSIYLKIFDTDTASIYDETAGMDRYYRMSDGDYAKLLTMLIPESN